jgi:NTE family protein
MIQAPRLLIVFLVLVVSACSPITDKPIPHWTPELDRRAAQQVAGERSGDLLVFVAFSGGGTRAASFAYGVLKELSNTQVTTEKGSRPLLHEVDVISSVSGGSFTSAYYGLHGDRIFEEFEDRFLRKNVEGALLWRLLAPTNWVLFFSPSYGRGDMAAEYYSENLFDGATLSDLQRPSAPMVIINATDLPTGIRFAFGQFYFDLLCNDLGQYPLSRAVAASSGVPILFTPITIENFAGSCGYEPPAWLGEALKDETHTPRRAEARALEDYLDREKRPWLHLVDGGISDNLGLRSFYNFVNLIGDPRAAFGKIHHPDVRHILIISVDAHVKPKLEWPFKRSSPSLIEIIGSISGDQISLYSLDTIGVVRLAFERWSKQISTPQRPVTFDFAQVSIAGVRDDAERNFLNTIGTSFDLSDEQIDRLISAARKVLRESPELQAFLKRTQGRSK